MSTTSSKAGSGAPRPSKLHTSHSFTRYEPAGSNSSSNNRSSPRRSRASTLANEVLSETATDPLLHDGHPLVTSPSDVPASSNTSVFEKREDDDDGHREADTPTDRHRGSSGRGSSTIVHHSAVASSPSLHPDNLPSDFDALPIEIASWSDRFVADLTGAKVFPQPPTIDTLSDIFQQFYTKAEDRIGTHIRALATRQSRAASPAPVRSVKRPRPSPRLGSAASRDDLRRGSAGGGGGGAAGVEDGDEGGGQKMLTAGEVHEKRRAKRLLEYKRYLLEEAVERRVTEGLYEKLWRHKSSLDHVKDEKLRGKTGSLQLVGIGLKELGVDLMAGGGGGEGDGEGGQTPAERTVMIEEWISKAAEGLLKMNEATCPKGKLDELIAAHQRIVDLLTKVHRGSSSADEILPTLIYTLIACPSEGLNIISNMNFIQRFRAASKMNGEAAYCLTNLEAAITFLKTVDLASLRAEEGTDNSTSSNKQSTSQPATPLTATFNPKQATTAAAVTATTTTNVVAIPEKGMENKESLMEVKAPSRPSSSSSQGPRAYHNRRLSSLMAIPTNAFNSANEAVRSTAEESIRSVSTTLDNSFKLLFGRLREKQNAQDEAEAVTSPIVVPKTLDEARKLVTPKVVFNDDDAASETSSMQDTDDHPLKETDAEHDTSYRPAAADDNVLNLIVGRGAASATTAGKKFASSRPRDRSVDSKASDSSSIRAAKLAPPPISPAGTAAGAAAAAPSTGAPMPSPGAGALDNATEALRTFGNSFNPLNRLSGAAGGLMGMGMRGFGRTSTPPTPAAVDALAPPPPAPPPTRELDVRDPPARAPAKSRTASAASEAGRPRAASSGLALLVPLAAPPQQRFVDVRDAQQLRLADVQDLLDEYHRLLDCLKRNGLA